jgi:hypothetical protein
LTRGPSSVSHAFLGGFSVAAVFFLFTLYPLAVLLPLILVRWLLLKRLKVFIPFASAALSIAYVQLWVVMLGGDFRLFPEWVVSTVVVSFIIGSSFKLYPEFSNKYS